MTDTSNDATRRNRRVIIGIVAATAAPLLFALLLTSDAGRDLVPTHTPHGELLAEPLRVEALPVPGESETSDGGYGWSLSLALTGACDDRCESTLDYLHRAHMALGKSVVRMNRFVLTDAEALSADPPAAATAEPAAAVLLLSSPSLAEAAGGALPAVLVGDPGGRVVLRYRELPDFTDFVDDIKHLLGMKRH